MVYSVSVRNRMMIAHSFKGEYFGPAQELHGVTFVIDAKFYGEKLDQHSTLIDVCLAEKLLGDVVMQYHNNNLDTYIEFVDVNTTMETVARAIWHKIRAGLAAEVKKSGPIGANYLKVIIHESDIASAEFGGKLGEEASTGSKVSGEVWLIDVDDTLYSPSCDISRQIIQKTLEVAKELFAVDNIRSDEMFQKYGSTIIGLRELLKLNHKQMNLVYMKVFDSIDLSTIKPNPFLVRMITNIVKASASASSSEDKKLAGASAAASAGSSSSGVPSSFVAGSGIGALNSLSTPISTKKDSSLADASRVSVHLISNSPEFHVRRVLKRMEIHNSSSASSATFSNIISSIITPSQDNNWKSKPNVEFMLHLLRDKFAHASRVVLFDDNKFVVDTAKQLGFIAYQVTPQMDLASNIAAHIGIMPNSSSSSITTPSSALLNKDFVPIRKNNSLRRVSNKAQSNFNSSQVEQALLDKLKERMKKGSPAKMRTPASAITPSASSVASATSSSSTAATTSTTAGSGRATLRVLDLNGDSLAVSLPRIISLAEQAGHTALEYFALHKSKVSLERSRSFVTLRYKANESEEASERKANSSVVNLHFDGEIRAVVRLLISDLLSFKESVDLVVGDSALVDIFRSDRLPPSTPASLGSAAPLPSAGGVTSVFNFSSASSSSLPSSSSSLSSSLDSEKFKSTGWVQHLSKTNPQALLYLTNNYDNFLTFVYVNEADSERQDEIVTIPSPDAASASSGTPPAAANVAAASAFGFGGASESSHASYQAKSDRFDNLSDEDGKVQESVLVGYHQYLKSVGAHITQQTLTNDIALFGGITYETSSSTWVLTTESAEDIEAVGSILYNISKRAAAYMKNLGDLRAWAQRTVSLVQKGKIRVVVKNFDFLAALSKNAKTPRAPVLAKYLLFTAPGKVAVKEQVLTPDFQLADDEIRIETVLSGLSTGTELKVFCGQFESGIDADSTITSLAKNSFTFPMKYGYCVVGKVAAAGRKAAISFPAGKRVFAFHPHQSHCIVKAKDAIAIPDDVTYQDAVFLPSVETAVCLVHDMNPRLDERVAVVGQGVVGLLVSSILAKGKFAQLSVFEKVEKRIEIARKLSKHIRINKAPSLSDRKEEGEPNGFDTVLEVTGNPNALNSALSMVGYGGRLVIGSWFGNQPVCLQLGSTYHRSHIQIISSQVSELPASLKDRWTKTRRMNTSWNLIRELRPSTYLLSHEFSIKDAPRVYDAINKNRSDYLQVVFSYQEQ